jgi:hypothetical protein
MCVGNRTCQDGVCACPEEWQLCGGVCADVQNDAENCGECELACESDGLCLGGACSYPTVLAEDQGNPLAIALDATNVYWTTGSDVRSMPIDGGDVAVLGEPGAGYDLALDEQNLYWADTIGRIYKLPLAGGDAVNLAAGTRTPTAIAVDESNVYWVDSGLKSVPIEGGDVTLLAPSENANQPLAIAVGPDGLYTAGSSSFYRTTFEGGSVTRVGARSDASNVTDLLVSDGGSYYAATAIWRLDSAVAIFASETVRRIAFDGAFIYYASTRGIGRVATDGSETKQLALDAGATGIALDEASVYWTSGAEGTASVRKIAK